MAHYFRVDHRHRLVTVFSPKCASSTIRHWLAELDRQGGDAAAAEPDGNHHTTSRQLDGCDDYYKVFFVRDPLRRLVSFYAHWAVRVPAVWNFADHRRRFDLDRRSFRRFLYVLDHLHRNRLRFQHHLEPQLTGTSGIAFDQVIRVEDLREALGALSRRLGLQYTPERATLTRYSPQLTGLAADRPPSWFRRHGVPEARWFFDRELLELGQRIYAEDIACYRDHGGETLTLEAAPEGSAGNH